MKELGAVHRLKETSGFPDAKSYSVLQEAKKATKLAIQEGTGAKQALDIWKESLTQVFAPVFKSLLREIADFNRAAKQAKQPDNAISFNAKTTGLTSLFK